MRGQKTPLLNAKISQVGTVNLVLPVRSKCDIVYKIVHCWDFSLRR